MTIALYMGGKARWSIARRKNVVGHAIALPGRGEDFHEPGSDHVVRDDILGRTPKDPNRASFWRTYRVSDYEVLGRSFIKTQRPSKRIGSFREYIICNDVVCTLTN